MTRHEKCNTCRFSRHVVDSKPDYWECRLRAPIPSPEDGSGWWPNIKPDDWCGDWRETDEAAEKWEASRAKRWAELLDVHGRIPGTVVHPLCGRPIGDNAILTCHAPRGHDGNCWASR